MKFLIVGYGNPLRGDDAIGRHVAADAGRGRTDARVVIEHCLVPEVAEAVAASCGVVFVDAKRGDETGRVGSQPVMPEGRRGGSDHGVTPSALLQLARDIYGRCPRASLVTVESNSYEFRAPLSPDAEAAVPAAVDDARRRARRPLPVSAFCQPVIRRYRARRFGTAFTCLGTSTFTAFFFEALTRSRL